MVLLAHGGPLQATEEWFASIDIGHGADFCAQRVPHQSVFLLFDRVNATIVVVEGDTGWEVTLAPSRWGHLTHLTCQVPDFALKSRHESVLSWIVRLFFDLFAKLFFCFLLTFAQCILEELLRPSLLHGLLLQNVLQQVFVSLNQSLWVDLSVFDLFFTISLDALQKSLQRLLMLLPQFFHFSHQCHLQIFIHYICLIGFLLLYHRTHSIRLIVILHTEEDLFLLAHLNQTLAIALFQQELLGDLFFMQD